MALLTTATFVKFASAGKLVIPLVHFAHKAMHRAGHETGGFSLFGEVLGELNAITASLHGAELHDLLEGHESESVSTANQHFAKFIGFVLRELVAHYAALPENADIKKDLDVLATALPEAWLEAASEEAAGLQAEQARTFLADLRAALDGKAVVPDEKELAAQLRRIARSEELVNLLPADTLDRLSHVLAKVLPDALASAIVHDNAVSESAFKKACLRFQNEVLHKLDKLQDGMDAANAALKVLLARKPLHQYFANLQRRFSKHNALGIPAVEDTKQKQGPDKIEDLFVLPSCTTARLRPEDLPAALKDEKNKPVALLPRLAQERRVVLLADPGMGKSTLIQWLVVALTDPMPPPDAAAFGKAIPLPFILRDLVPLLPRELKKWTWKALVVAFLKHQHDKDKPAMAKPLADDEGTLREVLNSPQAWFLIDGLDEVGDKTKREALREAIWQGFTTYEGARFLITSRVVGYEEAEVDREVTPLSSEQRKDLWASIGTENQPDKPWTAPVGNGDPLHPPSLPPEIPSAFEDVTKSDDEIDFSSPDLEAPDLDSIEIVSGGHWYIAELATLLYLAPWDDKQQSAFAQNWFHQRLGDSDGPVRAREFVQAVHDHPSISAIGRVPNLLLLMALLYRYGADLPHGRAKVYAAISKAYLENIADVRRIDHRTKTSVPYTLAQKERLLAIIAMHMQVRRSADPDAEKKKKEAGTEILASRKDLETWLCAEFGKASDQENAAEMKKFIDHIADSSGLLLPRGVVDGVEQFAFAHLSFQEFYTACWLELEFSQQLNLRAGGGGFLSVSVPAPDQALTMTEGRFGQRAAFPVWREPLLFLAEKLSERPADTSTLCNWLFPIRNGDTAPLPMGAQQLLATFSIDPQVSFTPEQRQAIWDYLCRAHLDNRKPWAESVASALLVPSPFCSTISATLLRLVAETQATTLWLSSCTGVTDLGALKNLRSLQTLSLKGCTGVCDLDALKNLRSLQRLYLDGCTRVSDLDALKNLRSLQRLYLDGCTRVSGLGALKDLRSLQELYLTGCTGVNDLGALKNLSNLQELNLAGCTSVSDLDVLKDLSSLQTLNLVGCTGVNDLKHQVATLRNALPECGIVA